MSLSSTTGRIELELVVEGESNRRSSIDCEVNENEENENFRLPSDPLPTLSVLPAAATASSASLPIFSFSSINIFSSESSNPIAFDVSGFINRNELTCLIGSNGSGKSILLQTLADYRNASDASILLSGRIVVGDQTIHSEENRFQLDGDDLNYSIAYIPNNSEDFLIGELTVEETLLQAGFLNYFNTNKKSSGTLPSHLINQLIQESVDQQIAIFGLSLVRHSRIGTVLQPSLSGGEKRRVAIAAEIILKGNLIGNRSGSGSEISPETQNSFYSIFLFDDPTAGLDTFSAFELLQFLKEIVKLNPRIGILCALNQPNSAMMALFSSIILLHQGRLIYLGEYFNISSYFQSFWNSPAFQNSSHLTSPNPIESILHNLLLYEQFMEMANEQLKAGEFFAMKFSGSKLGKRMKKKFQIQRNNKKLKKLRLTETSANSSEFLPNSHFYDHNQNQTQAQDSLTIPLKEFPARDKSMKTSLSWSIEFIVLLKKLCLQSSRDLTLYWLQSVLTIIYYILVGLVFYESGNIKNLILDDRTDILGNSVLWVIIISSYSSLFKVFHFHTQRFRVQHLYSNGNISSPTVFLLADSLVTSFFQAIFLMPGSIMAVYMIDYPESTKLFVILSLFVNSLISTFIMEICAQISASAAGAALLGQCILLVLTVFSGGQFVKDSAVGFWVWISKLSLFYWSARGMLISVFKEVHYECPNSAIFVDSITTLKMCKLRLTPFECENQSLSECFVSGKDLLIHQREFDTSENPWNNFVVLIALLISVRIFNLFLHFLPFSQIKRILFDWIGWSKLQKRMKTLSSQLLWLDMKILSGQQFAEDGRIVKENDESESEMSQLLNDRRASFSVSALNRGSRMGSSAIIEISTAAPALTWKNLNVELKKNHRQILNNLTGSMSAGSILGVIGGSGSGKSTFLKAISLNTSECSVTGGIPQLYGREVCNTDYHYTPQEFSLNPNLTVRRTMKKYFRLFNEKEKSSKIEILRLLDELHLISHEFSVVSSLTAGERRRLLIAVALIASPKILLLDEITTNLDSESAHQVMTYLKNVTRARGLISILTIHQPAEAIFTETFDSLMVLHFGQLVYLGKSTLAVDYFSQVAPPKSPETTSADYILSILQREAFEIQKNHEKLEVNEKLQESAKGWRKMFDEYSAREKSSDSTNVNNNTLTSSNNSSSSIQTRPRPTEFSRFQFLARFYSKMLLMQPNYFTHRGFNLFLLGIFIGTIFFQPKFVFSKVSEIVSGVWVCFVFIVFIGVSSTPEWTADRFVFLQELRNNCYSILTYYSAIFAASILYYSLISAAFTLITWILLSRLYLFESLIFSFLMNSLILMVMDSLSMISVEITGNSLVATTLGVVLVGSFLLFSTFFVSFNRLPPIVRWIPYILPAHYMISGMIINGFNQVNLQFDSNPALTISGSDFVHSQFPDILTDSKWFNLLIVFGFLIGLKFTHIAIVYWNCDRKAIWKLLKLK